MEARHAYIKGLRGNGIFYRSEDFIVLITIVSVLVKKGGVKVMAFCPMFNHIHFLIKNISLNDLRRFIQRLAIIFVKEYNNEYGRKGTVFQKPFGCSLKRTIKIIMGCVAYVFKLKKITLLGNVADSLLSAFSLNLQTPQLTQKFRKELVAIVKANSGNIPLKMYLYDPGTKYNIEFHSTKFQVAVTSDFVSSLKLMGINCSPVLK